MDIKEKIVNYLLIHKSENKYRLATALKANVTDVVKALDILEQEGSIAIREGKVIPLKGKVPEKAETEKKQPIAAKEDLPKEELVEASKEKSEEGQPEETPSDDMQAAEQKDEEVKEERIEGTVKFFNPKKGFGFIIGDDGKDYYVNESSLKEGIAIDSDDRVSFKVVQETQGPKAEEVEKIGQSVEE